MIDARFRNIDGPDKPRPVEAMNDARLWHPWLRINRVLRVMLHTHWSAEAWSQARVEFGRALVLRREIWAPPSLVVRRKGHSRRWL